MFLFSNSTFQYTKLKSNSLKYIYVIYQFKKIGFQQEINNILRFSFKVNLGLVLFFLPCVTYIKFFNFEFHVFYEQLLKEDKVESALNYLSKNFCEIRNKQIRIRSLPLNIWKKMRMKQFTFGQPSSLECLYMQMFVKSFHSS